MEAGAEHHPGRAVAAVHIVQCADAADTAPCGWLLPMCVLCRRASMCSSVAFVIFVFLIIGLAASSSK